VDAGLAGPGRKIRQGDTLTKTGDVGENRQRRFFDEHGLDARLAVLGRKIHQGDTLKKTGDVGENRQRRFFDEHGLDAGLAGPGRKIRQGDTLTKTEAVGENQQPTRRCEFGSARQLVQVMGSPWLDLKPGRGIVDAGRASAAACRARCRGACRRDSPRGPDSAGQCPRRALRSHGYGRKWRVPGASPARKIPGNFSKINQPAWRLNVESCTENNF